MTIAKHIKDEKLPYHIDREAVKISALTLCKIDRWRNITFRWR